MMRIIFFLAGLLTTGFCAAQEYWLLPDRFKVKPGETLTIEIKKGEKLIAEAVEEDEMRLEVLSSYFGGQGEDDDDKLTSPTQAKMTLTSEGTLVLVAASTEKIRNHEAEAFNNYLQDYGLDDVISFRKKNNLVENSATELNTHYFKLIVQSGEKKDETNEYMGDPIEIIAEQNPYSLKLGDRITFKIVSNGKPLFGARVKVQNRYQNRSTLQNIYTMKDGTIETTLSNPGVWMVSVVKMSKSKDYREEWKSETATLVFSVFNL